MVIVSLFRGLRESGDLWLGVGNIFVVTGAMVVTVQVELATGEDSKTPEGEFGDLPELVITVQVVSIGGDILEVGLVTGRLEERSTDSNNGVIGCTELDAATCPSVAGTKLFPLLVKTTGPKQ